ncbi:unnamed protein product [Prorocentrum cordatum]|uniref:Uncharacterized protein n=1 Tax=Prorocentrum cordatum TaxID=2364126 RepID=A0ABN9Q877_9DINO|nr:unnamed protein product [Polarella glacialis]
MTCDIGGALKQEIQGYRAKVQPMVGDATVTKHDLELDIQAVKVEPCFDGTTGKPMLAAPHRPMCGAVTRAFMAEGVATRHAGPAPPGWLEDEAASWLECFR